MSHWLQSHRLLSVVVQAVVSSWPLVGGWAVVLEQRSGGGTMIPEEHGRGGCAELGWGWCVRLFSQMKESSGQLCLHVCF